MQQKIVIQSLGKPQKQDIKTDIFWMCDSLGFNAGRDTEQLSNKIVFDIVDNISKNIQPSSEMLAEALHISAARVNHHIRNLINSGFIYRNKRHLFLRGGSLKDSVEELRRDANRMFDDLSMIAQEIDNSIGIRSR